jgi:hypothetical protein
MLGVAGLMVEVRRGTEAVKLALLAGSNLVSPRKQPTPEPSGGGSQ